MSFSDMMPLERDGYHLAMMISEDRFNEPHDHYDWRDELLVADPEEESLAWVWVGAERRQIPVVFFYGEFDGYGPMYCVRCGAALEHSQVVLRHNATHEVVCAKCSRELSLERWFISVYLVNRAFGGPHEGGWWYDCGEIVDYRMTTRESSVSHLKRKLAEMYPNDGRLPASSVNSEGEYRVRVTRHRPVEFFPEAKPHYE
jgi:hypothetical protein